MSLTPVILVPAMLPCYVLMARQMKIVPNRAKPAKPYQTVPAGWWQQHYQQQRYARFVFSVSLFLHPSLRAISVSQQLSTSDKPGGAP